MKMLSLNPEKQAALDAKVNAEIEKQITAMVERLEAKIEQRIGERLDAKLKQIDEKIEGCAINIDSQNHRIMHEHARMNRVARRVRAMHYRLTKLFDWYNAIWPNVPEVAQNIEPELEEVAS
jgi:DNA repair ATPase RecN